MVKLRVRFFNHVTNKWEELREANGQAKLFDSHPEALQAAMREYPRQYQENEIMIVSYIVCKCGQHIEMPPDTGKLSPIKKEKYRCWRCRRIYDACGKPLITYATPPKI